MRIILLGTGNGDPNPRRYPTSIAVEADNNILLFDSGPGILWQLGKAGIKFEDVDHIFYTHYFHADHICDLPAFVHAFKGLERRKDLNLYGPTGLRKFVNKTLSSYSYFKEIPFKINVIELGNHEIKIGDIYITTKPMLHGKEEDKSIGYRVEFDNKSFFYSGDTKPNENMAYLARNADMLILESGAIDPNEIGGGHLTPEDCGKIAEKAKTKKLIIVHIPPEAENAGHKKIAEKFFKGTVVVGTDLMEMKL